MKKKLLGIILITAVFGFFAACDNDDEPVVLPTCDETCKEEKNADGKKAHLGIDESCNHSGKSIQGDCVCESTVYDTVAGIKIYREKSVTDAQAKLASAEFLAQYTILKEEFEGVNVTNINTTKISAIHLTSDTVDFDYDNKIMFITHSLRGKAMKDQIQDFSGDWLSF